MKNLDHIPNHENGNKKGQSFLATAALTGVLLFGSCSNNTSIDREYQHQQTIENTIRKQERKLNQNDKERQSLIESRIKYAIRYNEKLQTYNYLKNDPRSTQRLARLEHSMIQLANVVAELDKKIGKLENDGYKISKKLDYNIARSSGSGVSASFQPMEVYVRDY